MASKIERLLMRSDVWKCSCPEGFVNEHIIARTVYNMLVPKLECECGGVKLRFDWESNTWFVKGKYYAPYGWVNCINCEWRVQIAPDLKAEGQTVGKGRWAGRKPADTRWDHIPQASDGGVREVPASFNKGVRAGGRAGRRQGRHRGGSSGSY